MPAREQAFPAADAVKAGVLQFAATGLTAGFGIEELHTIILENLPLLPFSFPRVKAGLRCEVAQTSTHFGRNILSRDRRGAVRHAVRSLAYVELGEENGGVALNVSEGGIAIQAVMALNADDLPAIRIQLAHSKKQIEARGRVAWTSNLRRLAGVEFVDLSDESRIQIREWISLESADLRPIQSAERRDNDDNGKKIIEPQHSGLTIGVTSSAVVSQAGTEAARPSSPAGPASLPAPQKRLRRAVLPASEVPPAFVPGPYQLVGQTLPVPADISNRVSDKVSETSGATDQRQADAQTTAIIASGKVKTSPTFAAELPSASVTARDAAEIPEDRYGLKRQTKGTSKHEAAFDDERDFFHTFAWVCIFTLISLGAGWLAGHGDWKDVAQRIHTAVSTNESVVGQKAQPVLPPNTLEIEIVDANKNHWMIPLDPRGSAGATATNQPISGSATHLHSIVIPRSGLPAPVGSRGAANGSNAVPPDVKPATAESSSLLPMLATGEPGGSLSLPIQQAPITARSGIQPGELIYKVDPAYPKAAMFQKVEGIVKIAVVIGADGTVKDVQPLSGPRSLIPAAMDAIRQWRYSPTLLNGQPIETKRQISVAFRLAQTF